MDLVQHPLKGKWVSSRDRVKGARLRLFCLPHAGSGAAAYQSWKRELPPFVEVCAVRLPGRETRLAESPFSDSKLLVQQMTEVLAEDCGMPYAIFGHSMGALLAYEFAQSLRDKGLQQPACLFLSGRIAAHLALRTSPLHELPLDRFLAELEVRYGGLPQELLQDREMLDFYLPILRADLQLIETYQYQVRKPLDCPISVSAGTDDRSIWTEGLLEWQQHTTRKLDVHRFEGGHFYLADKGRPAFMHLLNEKLIAIGVEGQL